MANTIQLLRSTTAGNKPSSLASGQIAINERDAIIYYRAAATGAVTALPTGSSLASYATTASFPATGTSGTLYLAESSKLYRWESTVYVEVGTIAPVVSASDIASGTVATARLGSGTASATTYLRGDQTYAAVVNEFDTTSGFPVPGASAVTYIATDTGRTYRFTGSQYVETGSTPATVSATDPTAGLTLLHPFLLGGM